MTSDIQNAINTILGRPWFTLHIWKDDIKAYVVALHRNQIHFIRCDLIHDDWVAEIESQYILKGTIDNGSTIT